MPGRIWWPRKAFSDWQAILDNDWMGDFPTRTAEHVAAYDRLNDELTRDPQSLGLFLELAHGLPKWLGNDDQRLSLAYEALYGVRAEGITAALKSLANSALSSRRKEWRMQYRQKGK